MPPLHDLLPTRFDLPTAHRPLLAFAAIVAVSLLSFYVHLLHESMALGEQMRERQRNTVSVGSAKALSQRLPTASAQARTAPDGAGARSR
jgi:hypothetical protein